MPKALELVTSVVTFSNNVATAAAALAGNTLTVRNARPDSQVLLVNAWADYQFAGTLSIRSPRLHDNVRGLRFDIVAGDLHPLLPPYPLQRLYPQDQLTVEVTTADAAGDLEYVCMLLYYESLDGSDARLIDAETLRRRAVNLVTVESTLATGATAAYGGAEAINAESDLLKANTDYALIGYYVDTECAAVRWSGADIANMGVGGPGEPGLRESTRKWFLRLAEDSGLPLIPVFNSANRAGIQIDAAQDENGADTTVVSIFAELGPGGGPTR